MQLKTYSQQDRHSSPFSMRQRVRKWIWQYCWSLFCSWTPPPFNSWRLFWLKLFGCKISGTPIVHPRAIVEMPWNLILHDRATMGDGARAYSLDTVELDEQATLAQEAYLCTGTHKLDEPDLPLQTAPIKLGKNCFVGARAFVLPGVVIGEGAVVGACAVVSRDIPPYSVWVGNPARFLKERVYKNKNDDLNQDAEQ